MAVVHELLFARRLILANGKAENVTSGRFQVTDQATSLHNDADQLVLSSPAIKFTLTRDGRRVR